LGWTQTGAGSAWTSPGIGSADVRGPSFLFSDINANGYQRKSVVLDASSVQQWVQGGAANQGLVLVNQNAGKVLRIYSSEAVNASHRPTLSVTYQ